MHFVKRHAKGLVLLLVLGTGIMITAPYARFQDFLSQGDHGRDLYAAEAVYRGELPYRDFWWVYGPLMPYYYGLFYKIFGVQISSIILGKLVLKVLGGILISLAMMEISSPTAALLTSCWFMLFTQDFFFTYNHTGGIVMILGVAFCLLSYIRKNRLGAAWGALAFIFLLSLIKINFGLAALVVCVITVAVSDFVRRLPLNRGKQIFYTTAFIGLPLVLITIYWSLLKNLSIMEIRQCLPYVEGDQPYTTSPWIAISSFFQITFHTATSNWPNFIFAVIINASGLRCLYLFGPQGPQAGHSQLLAGHSVLIPDTRRSSQLFAKNKLPSARKITLGLSLGLLGLFYIANLHEYLKSGVWYRAFWAQPLSIMISFLLIDIASQSVPKIMRRIVFTFIAVLLVVSWQALLPRLKAVETKSHYLSLSRGGVYISNSPSWIATVQKTTTFLNKTLKPNELFFALPYDCLYYYLTGKKTPTRQLIFFEHIKIPPQQEKSVIAELEKTRVNYVLMSSRAYARQEFGLGFLGTTYCPLIGKYIQENFVPMARFGDWTHEPGWAWNHGTLILKRLKTAADPSAAGY